jgi:hypothetical protein
VSQGDLFAPRSRYAAPAAPFQKHSDTSVEAAERIAPKAPSLRERVYAFIRFSVDGRTNEEIESGCGMPGNTVRPRVVELVKAGRVRDSGATRETRSGRQAVVWVAT